jgi:hypothetical protein
MVIYSPGQLSYNAGEFSPSMYAREDFEKYSAALTKGENLILLPQGGACRRAGSRYVAAVKDSTALTHLIPFVFSTTQAYQVEVGNNYLRFYADQAQIVTEDIAAAITGNNSTFLSGIGNWDDQGLSGGAGSSVTHDATNARMNLIAPAVPATNFAHAELQVTNAEAKTFVLRLQVLGAPGDTVKLRVGTASDGTQIINDQVLGVGYHVTEFSSGAADFFIGIKHDTLAKTLQIDNVDLLDNAAIELTTPYATSEIADIDWTQSTDTLYLFHKSYPIYTLLRLGNASWSLEEFETVDGPYLDENATTTTLTAASAAVGTSVNITASSIVGINDNRGWLASDIGRLVRIGDGTDVGYGVIVSITSTTVAVADIRKTLPNATANTEWRLGSWSGTTGYPTTGSFHEQRLGIGNTPNDPDQYWLSASGDFPNFAIDTDLSGGGVEVLDNNSIDYRISSDQVNAILWMKSGRFLALGTTGGEWIATSEGPILTPSDNDTNQQTRVGSKDVLSVQVDNTILYTQRGGRQIHEFAFRFEDDAFRSPDLTLLSRHITRTGITRMAYATAPHSLVLCLRADGKIAVLTYKREEDVVGWSRWTMGGTDVVVESISVIPGEAAAGQVASSVERDEIWVVVSRTINGATKRYIEVLEDVFEGPDANDHLTKAAYEAQLLIDQQNMYYVDSCITYNSTATSALSGLGHLEGETVKILADGAVHPDKVVTSGAITLDADASIVQIGLGYFHDIEPLIIRGGNPRGSGLLKDKAILTSDLLLHETGSLKIGSDRSSLRDISFREVGDSYDTAVPLFSGIKSRVEISGDYIADPKVVIRDDEPTAFTLLGWVHDVELAP